jgi:hypothetical protein
LPFAAVPASNLPLRVEPVCHRANVGHK